MQVNRADYLNGRTALHFAAVSGHARCIRLIVADYVPNIPHLWNTLQPVNTDESASMKNYPDQRLFLKPILQLSIPLKIDSSIYFSWSGFSQRQLHPSVVEYCIVFLNCIRLSTEV